jgi:hypothetical protein
MEEKEMSDTIEVKKSDVLKAYEHYREAGILHIEREIEGLAHSEIAILIRKLFPAAFELESENKECEHEKMVCVTHWMKVLDDNTRACLRCGKTEKLYTGDEIVEFIREYAEKTECGVIGIYGFLEQIKSKFGGEK